MARKFFKQKYFVPKELRLSVALIILWALLSTAFFTYFAKELGGKIGQGIPLFAFIMVGYVAIVVFLTMLFSHRLIGPFQRLKTEMRMILAGECHRRLHLRGNDDVYIRSFVDEINKILEQHEELYRYKEGMSRYLDAEMLSLISTIEGNNVSKEKLRESVLELHKKLKTVG